jgi:hypothetical protein
MRFMKDRLSWRGELKIIDSSFWTCVKWHYAALIRHA